MISNHFRYEALLEIYQKQEDLLIEEISALDREKKAVRQRIQHLSGKWQEAHEMLAKGKNGYDVGATLQYLEGLLGWIQASKNQQALLDTTIIEKRRVVQELRTERKRFGKLKERHLVECQSLVRTLEQKVTDEFAQRKKNL